VWWLRPLLCYSEYIYDCKLKKYPRNVIDDGHNLYRKCTICAFDRMSSEFFLISSSRKMEDERLSYSINKQSSEAIREINSGIFTCENNRFFPPELLLHNYKCGGYVLCCATVNTYTIVNWKNIRETTTLIVMQK
jgi:hypothetical protein